jgi:hypothetical protein
MLVDRVETARDQAARFGDVRIRRKLVVGRVQVLDAGGDDHALGIRPGALADAILGIHGSGAIDGLSAEIGAPGLAACTCLGGQCLAVTVGPFEAAIVGALWPADAGDEECHVGKLRGRLLRL